MRGICINRGLIEDLRIQKLILDKFQGYYIRNSFDLEFYRLNRETLNNSMTETLIYKKIYPELTGYIDEPISTPGETWKPSASEYQDTVFGELTDRAFNKLNGRITFTAYTKLIDFFGLFRIPIPFTNQLSTWEHIAKKYGQARFPIIWIKFGQSQELIDWAIMNFKQIWYYTEETDVNKLKRQIEKL